MIRREKTERIIFHHSLSDTGNVDTFRAYHMANGWADIGYHFVIAKDGKIQNGRNLRFIGAHALGKNMNSIGVCLIGDFRKYEPTIKQIEAAQRLFHLCCRAYNKSLKIEFHRNKFNPCPGVKLDRNDFIEIVSRADPYKKA